MTFFLSAFACNAFGAKSDVYIVPDIETYLYYISLWDADNQFPVFIGQNKYSEKFIEAYPKAKIIKANAVKIGNLNQQLVYKALYASWGQEKVTDIREEITKERIRERLKQLNRKPLGIIITNIGDMEFAGGFALAAGHKQLLDFYQSKWKASDSIDFSKISVKSEEKEKIRHDFFEIIGSWGYQFAGLNDDIDYITIALDIQHVTYIYNPVQKKETSGFSLDDAINRVSPDGFLRDNEGKPYGKSNVYAYVGRLVEAEHGMAVYQAMCSLFLPIRKAFYFDWWQERFNRKCSDAMPIIRKKIDATLFSISGAVKANLENWKLEFKNGNKKYDFIHVSAAGGYKDWRTGTTDDIPDTKPVVVYFAHSNASRNPKNNETIIGRWLRNGAYITYGSISEPYMPAFNTSKDVAESIVAGDPFGKAFQKKETLADSMRIPWKLMYVGDPLRRLEPECKQMR